MVRAVVAVTGLGLLLGAAVLLPLASARSAEPRDIVVVTRRMAFSLRSGAGGSNPVIRVGPGELVRLTLVNEDAGVDHDFAVEAWGVRTALLHGSGRTSVVFRAPERAGPADYVCARHRVMMRGRIVVAASGRDGAFPES